MLPRRAVDPCAADSFFPWTAKRPAIDDAPNRIGCPQRRSPPPTPQAKRREAPEQANRARGPSLLLLPLRRLRRFASTYRGRQGDRQGVASEPARMSSLKNLRSKPVVAFFSHMRHALGVVFGIRTRGIDIKASMTASCVYAGIKEWKAATRKIRTMAEIR
jgi:hypothetical protein